LHEKPLVDSISAAAVDPPFHPEEKNFASNVSFRVRQTQILYENFIFIAEHHVDNNEVLQYHHTGLTAKNNK